MVMVGEIGWICIDKLKIVKNDLRKMNSCVECRQGKIGCGQGVAHSNAVTVDIIAWLTTATATTTRTSDGWTGVEWWKC